MEQDTILEMSATDLCLQAAAEVMPEAVCGVTAAEALADDPPPGRQYCMIRSGWQRFCVSVLEIEEVVEWPKVTSVPLAPEFLLGIFNLRGAIVPIVDVTAGTGPKFDSGIKRIVIGFFPSADGHSVTRLGIAADEVLGTFTTAETPVSQNGDHSVPPCLGVLTVDEKDVKVLEIQRVAESLPIPAI